MGRCCCRQHLIIDMYVCFVHTLLMATAIGGKQYYQHIIIDMYVCVVQTQPGVAVQGRRSKGRRR